MTDDSLDVAIEAGVDALFQEVGTGRPLWLSEARAEQIVRRVYEVVAGRAPRARTTAPFVLRLDTSELQRQLAQFTEAVQDFKDAVEAATMGEDG